MLTFLITGGAGFIGSHLSDRCLELGHRVIVVDDLSGGSEKNITHLREHPYYTLIRQPVNAEVLRELIPAADVVFHLVPAAPRFGNGAARQSLLKQSFDTTGVILEAAANSFARVILTSSGDVYPTGTSRPLHEDSELFIGSPRDPRRQYVLGKIMEECLAGESPARTTVVRLFPTIGPRQNERYATDVLRMLSQALHCEYVTIYGGGDQIRSFVYVSDVIHWLLLLANNNAAVGQAFNLGNPHVVTVKELAQRVIAVSDATVQIQYAAVNQLEKESIDVLPLPVPDISKVTSLTGYSPRVGLDDALRTVYRWLRDTSPQTNGTGPRRGRPLCYEGYRGSKRVL